MTDAREAAERINRAWKKIAPGLPVADYHDLQAYEDVAKTDAGRLAAAYLALLAQPGEEEVKPDPVFAFLMGEGPLEGRHFGDDPPTNDKGRKTPYWWRTHLRTAIERLSRNKVQP